MRKVTLAFIVILLSAVAAFCADSSQADAKPKTKVEGFQAKYGKVIVKGYTTVGEVSRVSVDAVELLNVSTGESVTGIRIQVTGYRGDSHSSFIDYDEIAALVAGIEYVGKTTNTITKLKSFEATYSTLDDFKVTTFGDDDNKINVSVSSGTIGRVSQFIDLRDLATLKDYILKAKTTLDEIKK